MRARFYVEFRKAGEIGAFKGLAAEEQKHIEFIQSQIDALDKGKPASAALGAELERAGFFSQRAVSELIDQTTLEARVPDLPVLRMAFLIECDFRVLRHGGPAG